MDYLIYSRLKVPDRTITSAEAVDMVQEMVKQQVKATKDRKHVPEHRDRDLKVVRCLYTDVFRREVSKTETPRKSLESM